ncbi:MAG: hypothetical protein WAW42_07010 [Candidatus Competibacteraceae bacterium]
MAFSDIGRSWESCLRNHWALSSSLSGNDTKTRSEKLRFIVCLLDPVISLGIGNEKTLCGQGALIDPAQRQTHPATVTPGSR